MTEPHAVPAAKLQTFEEVDLIISHHSKGGIGSLEQRDKIHQTNRHCRELIEEKFPPFIRDTFPTPKEPTR